jgi:hypothetical protein
LREHFQKGRASVSASGKTWSEGTSITKSSAHWRQRTWIEPLAGDALDQTVPNECVSTIQRCQMIFFKSARSDIKIRQNPPSRIGKIRQKSARNFDDFMPFFTLMVVLVCFLVRISPYLRSGPGKIFMYFENILYNIFLF